MSSIASLTNPYDRGAKLYPMVITLLPLALAATVWWPEHAQPASLVGSGIVVLALASLMAQLARDRGKSREPELFRLWGGRPSDRALSFEAGVFSSATLVRRHRALNRIDPGLVFPASIAEERNALDAFRPTYAAGTELLLSLTRDRTRFALLFQENINYGFRRNLWGMKPSGIVLCFIGLCGAIARTARDMYLDQPIGPTPLLAAGLCIMLMVIWILRVTPAWVRVPADAYARQLAESCDRLGDVAPLASKERPEGRGEPDSSEA